MARDNFSYQKYQKELTRKKKTEEKAQKKLQKKAAEAALASGQVPVDQVVVNETIGRTE